MSWKENIPKQLMDDASVDAEKEEIVKQLTQSINELMNKMSIQDQNRLFVDLLNMVDKEKISKMFQKMFYNEKEKEAFMFYVCISPEIAKSFYDVIELDQKIELLNEIANIYDVSFNRLYKLFDLSEQEELFKGIDTSDKLENLKNAITAAIKEKSEYERNYLEKLFVESNQ